MRAPLRALSRLALSLGALGLPWTIACAYGTEFAYRLGRVIDRDTHQPIPGIEVTCTFGDRALWTATSDEAGEFSTNSDQGCERLEAADVDGEAHGAYAPASVPFPTGSGGAFTILMTKK